MYFISLSIVSTLFLLPSLAVSSTSLPFEQSGINAKPNRTHLLVNRLIFDRHGNYGDTIRGLHLVWEEDPNVTSLTHVQQHLANSTFSAKNVSPNGDDIALAKRSLTQLAYHLDISVQDLIQKKTHSTEILRASQLIGENDHYYFEHLDTEAYKVLLQSIARLVAKLKYDSTNPTFFKERTVNMLVNDMAKMSYKESAMSDSALAKKHKIKPVTISQARTNLITKLRQRNVRLDIGESLVLVDGLQPKLLKEIFKMAAGFNVTLKEFETYLTDAGKEQIKQLAEEKRAKKKRDKERKKKGKK